VGPLLERIYREFHREPYLEWDPLEIVLRYRDPWDMEAAALVGALLAYGNVKQIRRSVSRALEVMESRAGSLSGFVRGLSGRDGWKQGMDAFRGFRHRFNGARDVVLLLRLLAESWRRHGSLGAQFVAGLEPRDEDFGAALDRLVGEWKRWAPRLCAGRPAASFYYLLSSPSDGSCCKRWCMFLRWMGRKDELDPGLWTADGPLARTFPRGRALGPERLVIPLDTHTGRICRVLGLTDRRTLGWKAAIEVTRRLREVDPGDPVRFDFAICRLGMLEHRDLLTSRAQWEAAGCG